MVLAAVDNIQYDHGIDLTLHLVAHYDNIFPIRRPEREGRPFVISLASRDDAIRGRSESAHLGRRGQKESGGVPPPPPSCW